ncbi:histidinol-phosphate transaminase [Buchnera aphidicola]|uniref:histidinol-phosphate transaminase n=1 Tax=Buchnera aphidicola TaxID=9 RepID=UPI00313A7FC0
MKKLIPIHIETLLPYQSAKRIGLFGQFLLNANESPYNYNIQMNLDNLNRYPDFQPKKLLKKYSNYLQIQKKNILITRGSDEAIDLLIRTFCVSKIDQIMFCPPTYDMYEVCAKIYNIEIIKIPTLKSFQLNTIQIVQHIKYVKLLYICNPNNPTGNLIDISDLLYLLKKVPSNCLVIIDEAYIEFSSKNSSIFLLKKYSNLIILRTLSKAFGLAGIRCGFLIASSIIVNILKKVLAPYPVPLPVSQIAENALSKKKFSLIFNNIKKILENRDFFISKISNFPYVKKVYPSNTNFILIKFKNSISVFQYLLKCGFVVRDQSHKKILKNCLRITIGTKKECLLLIKSLFDGYTNGII